MWFKKEKLSDVVFSDSPQVQQYREQEEAERKRLEKIRACKSCSEIFQSYFRPLTYHSYDREEYTHQFKCGYTMWTTPDKCSFLEKDFCPKCNEIRDRQESVATWARSNYEKVEEFRRQEEKAYVE